MNSFNSLISRDLLSAQQDVKSNSKNTITMQEITYGLKNYIRQAVSRIITEERLQIRNSSDNTNRILLILLIIYVIGLALFYLGWAYPMASQFNTEIKVTFKMLNMIPSAVIQSIKPIREYLIKWAKKNNNPFC